MQVLSSFTYTAQFFPRWTYAKAEEAYSEGTFETADSADVESTQTRERFEQLTDAGRRQTALRVG